MLMFFQSGVPAGGRSCSFGLKRNYSVVGRHEEHEKKKKKQNGSWCMVWVVVLFVIVHDRNIHGGGCSCCYRSIASAVALDTASSVVFTVVFSITAVPRRSSVSLVVP